MKVLVAYVTRYGHARAVARAIAARLREHGITAETADLETQLRIPERYDAVVLGASTRFGHLPASVHHWIEGHRTRLGEIPTYAFATSWRLHPTARIARSLGSWGVRPRRVATFGGRIAYPRYPRMQRAAIAAGLAITGAPASWLHPSRDKVLTNWADVAAFADAIAAELVPDRRDDAREAQAVRA